MLTQEKSPKEKLYKWLIDRDTCFDSILFDLIDKASTEQLENIRTGFPEYVEVFEEFIRSLQK